MDARVSIIIPVYNAEKYISQCLDCICGLKAGGVEIICVDDGSVDKSPEIIAEYAKRHNNIALVRQENSGPGAARNNGIRKSRGEYIIFLDADDTVITDTLDLTLAKLDKYDADMWESDFFRVADNGTVLDRIQQIPESDEPLFGDEALRSLVSSGDCVWNVWRCIFKRSFIEENGLYFREDALCGEDMQFMIRALTAAKRIAFLHAPYYLYRVNYGSSLTRRYTAERTRQFTDMLLSSAEHLRGIDTRTAADLRKMLAREYILNISLYAECPRNERKAAHEYLLRAGTAAEHASGVYKAAAKFISVFGIPISAQLLLTLKRGKRFIRRLKQGKR